MEAVILTKDAYNDLVGKLETIQDLISRKERPEDKFIDNQDFLFLMKISKRTAQSWRDEGKIAFSQIGAKIYYRMTDVQELLNKNYNKPFGRK
ncbi:helix-turn-helix domain-containing protein [Solitalea sp. MAHUQ-68]|uniref:DNA-binding protein n=2 Tax=Solitalea TaxID=929509 RepID=A0A2S4ZWK0_9SPHI|nr:MULTISPECIES: helix-turn-helix domain-containing protein [Solitalea]MCO4293061.1 helix-turn-helix domain-containing protein [Solitalea agri]POY34666.1 DNA-binding protein [Solitalea longa]